MTFAIPDATSDDMLSEILYLLLGGFMNKDEFTQLKDGHNSEARFYVIEKRFHCATPSSYDQVPPPTTCCMSSTVKPHA
jgi:hypothetical protein